MFRLHSCATPVVWIFVLGVLCLPVFSTPIVVNNPSFEIFNPLAISYSGGNYNLGPIPSWTQNGPGPVGSWQANTASFSFIPDGNLIAYANSGYLFQVLGTTLENNTTYTLTAAIGRRLDGFSDASSIELLANGVILASATQPISGVALGGWTDLSAFYTSAADDPNAGQFLEIRLVFDGVNGMQSNFDNVRLDEAAVPEPASFLLMGAGIAALVLRRKLRA